MAIILQTVSLVCIFEMIRVIFVETDYLKGANILVLLFAAQIFKLLKMLNQSNHLT